MRRHELVGTLGRLLGTRRTRPHVLHPMAPLGAVGPGQGLIESSSSSFEIGGSTMPATGLAQLLQGPFKDTSEPVSQPIADLSTIQQTHTTASGWSKVPGTGLAQLLHGRFKDISEQMSRRNQPIADLRIVQQTQPDTTASGGPTGLEQVSQRNQPSADLGTVQTSQPVTTANGGNIVPGTGLAQLLQGPLKDTNEQVSQLNKQIADLRAVQQTHLETTAANTLALLQNTIAKASGGGSVAGTITNFASSFLGGGGLLSPILSGILSLFGGGGTKTAPAPLVPFQLPASIQYQGGVTANGQATAVDYGQSGTPRAVQSAAPAPQVNIQVSAMDSRSFLDHSDEIARAVRDAILHSSPLNDAIAEL